MTNPKRIGVFTRLLDPADPAARYRDALALIEHAEALGFDNAWVAQHHFDGHEGGLPSPFVFLAQAAARTSRIRLGTGIVTLALEDPIRVAEDAAVLDLLSGGRLELGFGTGGSPGTFEAFGLELVRKGEIFGRNLAIFLRALSGEELSGGARIYPAAPGIARRIWQATFTVDGSRRAGEAGDGLMLSRTQPRPPGSSGLALHEIQRPMIAAYREALPPDTAPRVMASRSVFIADDRKEALRFAEAGLARFTARLKAVGRPVPTGTLAEVMAGFDMHVGTPEDVMASLAADLSLADATEVAVQVHSSDPPLDLTLRSAELFAQVVAPGLGWRAPVRTQAPRLAAAGL